MNTELIPKGHKFGSHLVDQKPACERKERKQKRNQHRRRQGQKGEGVKWI